MKTIVHIGMPKTGSTALQRRLRKSAAYLAGRGLLYPENPPGRASSSHPVLIAPIAPPKGLPRRLRQYFTKDGIDDGLADFIRHARRQIDAQRPDGLILSTEALFRPVPEDKRATLRQTFDALGTTPHFVAYLRRPSEHYLSSMQQGFRASAIVRPPKPRAYRQVLESYDAAFGEAAVSARLFHRDHLEKGDIVADFFKSYLAEFQIDNTKLHKTDRANATLSAEAMDVLQRYRAAFHVRRNNVFTDDTNALRVALIKADRLCDAPRPQLRPGVAATVDYASPDCLWIRDRFGVVFPDFDYDRLAAAPAAVPDPMRAFALQELIVIDRELQARLLATLAQSPWAEDAVRQAWLGTLLAPRSTRTSGAEAGL